LDETLGIVAQEILDQVQLGLGTILGRYISLDLGDISLGLVDISQGFDDIWLGQEILEQVPLGLDR
jgi:hypothetical protein